ncbi:MAG: hypothetical protein ABIE68_00260 [bacterium]
MRLVSIKEKATNLRKQGYSYNMISEETGLAKSTLSDWLKEIPFKPNRKVLYRVKRGQLKSALFKQNQRLKDIRTKSILAKKEIGKISKRDLLFLGIGLYLGEGSKLNESVRIINSDPDILKAAIKWFKDICDLKNENLVPSVHLYPDSNIKIVKSYWSKKLKIPLRQFGKTQIDKRKGKAIIKRGKLPYGTIHLNIKSCGNKRFGRSLHRHIMGWIRAINSQL